MCVIPYNEMLFWENRARARNRSGTMLSLHSMSQQGCLDLIGVSCVPAGCRVSVGAQGRSPEQPAP